MLGNLTAACELNNSEICLFYYVFHGCIAAIDEVYILGWHAASLGE